MWKISPPNGIRSLDCPVQQVATTTTLSHPMWMLTYRKKFTFTLYLTQNIPVLYTWHTVYAFGHMIKSFILLTHCVAVAAADHCSARSVDKTNASCHQGNVCSVWDLWLSRYCHWGCDDMQSSVSVSEEISPVITRIDNHPDNLEEPATSTITLDTYPFRSSKMSVHFYQNTRGHIPENGSLHIQWHFNILKLSLFKARTF